MPAVTPQPNGDSSSERGSTDTREEFYRLGCVVLRLIILAVSEACARNWGRRLDAWSRAVVTPSDGYKAWQESVRWHLGCHWPPTVWCDRPPLVDSEFLGGS